jgi:hypothetical protein
MPKSPVKSKKIQQLRSIDDTQSAMSVVKEEFFPEKLHPDVERMVGLGAKYDNYQSPLAEFIKMASAVAFGLVVLPFYWLAHLIRRQ